MKINLAWKRHDHKEGFELKCNDGVLGFLDTEVAEEGTVYGDSLRNVASDVSYEFEDDDFSKVKAEIEHVAKVFFTECFGDVEIVINDSIFPTTGP